MYNLVKSKLFFAIRITAILLPNIFICDINIHKLRHLNIKY